MATKLYNPTKRWNEVGEVFKFKTKKNTKRLRNKSQAQNGLNIYTPFMPLQLKSSLLLSRNLVLIYFGLFLVSNTEQIAVDLFKTEKVRF